MRTTVDIPDETYRRLKAKAALQGSTVRQLVLNGVQRAIDETRRAPARRLARPILASRKPGSIRLTSEQVYDLIGFP